MQDYKEKVNLIDELNEKLSLSETENLAFKLELTTNKTKVEKLEKDLTDVVNKKSKETLSKQLSESTVQTEAIEIKEISTNTSFTVENPSEPRVETITAKIASTTSDENVPSSLLTSHSETSSSGVEEISKIDSDDASQIDTELKLIHHPDVQREEELIIFKEKYTKLVEEKLKLDQELIQLREDYHQYRNKSIVHLLIYLAPIFALISYLFSYMMSSNN